MCGVPGERLQRALRGAARPERRSSTGESAARWLSPVPAPAAGEQPRAPRPLNARARPAHPLLRDIPKNKGPWMPADRRRGAQRACATPRVAFSDGQADVQVAKLVAFRERAAASRRLTGGPSRCDALGRGDRRCRGARRRERRACCGGSAQRRRQRRRRYSRGTAGKCPSCAPPPRALCAHATHARARPAYDDAPPHASFRAGDPRAQQRRCPQWSARDCV